MIESELKRTGLYIISYHSLDPNRIFLAISASDELYRKVAHHLKLEVETKSYGILLEYNIKKQEDFMPFTQWQKHRMIQYLIEDEIDIQSYINNNVVLDILPLHDSFKKEVETAWSDTGLIILIWNYFTSTKTHSLMPIFLFAAYFGEKLGIYMAFITFYLSSLVPLSIFGLALTGYQIYLQSIDNEFVPIYCLIISLWITIMKQVWNRREAEFAHIWNMENYKQSGTERSDFRYECRIDREIIDVQKKAYTHSKLRTIFFSAPMIIFGLALIIAAFIGFRIWGNLSTTFEHNIMVGSINGITIYILNYVYTLMAFVLTNLENHQYEEAWEESYFIKTFAMQFVNCYISLFAIAFYDADINNIAYSLGSIFVVKQFLTNVVNLTIPHYYIRRNFGNLRCDLEKHPDFKNDLELQRKVRKIEKDYMRFYPVDPNYDYCEMVIQMGYLTMFSYALPAAPFFAFLQNFWEVKSIFEFVRKK